MRWPVAGPLVAILAALALVGVAPPGHAQDLFHYADQFFATVVGPDKVPHEGTVHLAVLPLTFGSDPGYDGFVGFFDPDPDAGYTFSNYWRIQSGGRYDPIVTVEDPVPTVCPVGGFGGCSIGIQEADAAAEMLLDAFAVAMVNNPNLLPSIDWSGEGGEPDGWTDGVIVLAPGWWGGIAPPVWPFADVVQGDVQIGNVSISELDRETVLHEFGHNLGACDQYLWIHKHSLMSTCLRCSLDVHSRVALGWADLVEVGPGETVTVELLPGPGEQVARIGSPPEYFLVERRAPYFVGGKSFDNKVDGLLVVHVDETLPSPVLGQAAYPLWHPLLKVERAPGGTSSAVMGPGDSLLPAADHGPTAEGAEWQDTNWYDGTASGVRVEAIEVVHGRLGFSGAPAYRVTLTGPTGGDPQPEDDPPEDDPPEPDAGTPADTSAPIEDAGPADEPEPDDEPAPEPGDGGGCAAAPSAPWWLALMALGLRRRRRC